MKLYKHLTIRKDELNFIPVMILDYTEVILRFLNLLNSWCFWTVLVILHDVAQYPGRCICSFTKQSSIEVIAYLHVLSRELSLMISVPRVWAYLSSAFPFRSNFPFYNKCSDYWKQDSDFFYQAWSLHTLHLCGYGITEWVGLEGTLKIMKFKPLS